MPAQAQVYTQTVIGDASPDHAAETIIATVPGVSIGPYNANIRFVIDLGFTTGADSTATVLTVRRNTVTGAIIGQATTYPTVAATANQLPLIVAGNEPLGLHAYVLTVTQTGASADGTVNNVAIIVLVGN